MTERGGGRNAPAARWRRLARQAARDWGASLAVAAGFLLVWALFVHGRVYSTNEASRLAAIESRVTRGTWVIDESPFNTLDKIQVDGHFYSDKPPLPAWLGAGVYGALYHGLGLTLNAEACVPQYDAQWCRALWLGSGTDWAFVTLVGVLVALPAAGILALHWRAARRLGLGWGPALALTTALGLATALFPFSTVLNNHVPAAAGVTLAVYLCLVSERLTPRRLALAGFGAALAFTFDLSAGLFLAALLVYSGLRERRGAGWYLLGAAGPLLVSAALNWQIVGNPWPPQLYAAGYSYPGSVLGGSVAGYQATTEPVRYAFDMLVGARGVLAFFPILLFVGWGAARAARQARAGEHRRLAAVLAGTTVLFVAYFIFSTDNFGGAAYSPRNLIIPVPLLALAALPGLRGLKPGHWLAWAGLAALSGLAAFQGALSPWYVAAPPLRLAFTTTAPVDAPPVVLAGYGSLDELEDEARLALGANFIQPRLVDPRTAFVVPPDEGWWFLQRNLPLAPEFVEALGDGVTTAHALRANLRPAAEAWIATMQTQVGTPPDDGALVPGTARADSLPQTFDADLTLVGYDARISEGALRLVTAWRLERQPAVADQRRVEVWLVGADGAIMAEVSAFDTAYSLLQPGDLVLQLVVVPLPADALNSPYTAVVGVVEPVQARQLALPSGAQRLFLSGVGE